MEYVYASLLLHSLGKEINEENVKKTLEAAGSKADEAKIKALVASLDGVNIEEAIKNAIVAPVAAPAASAEAGEAKAEAKDEPSEEEQEKKAEEAASGLASLFG